jgi:hypothetical protein
MCILMMRRCDDDDVGVWVRTEIKTVIADDLELVCGVGVDPFMQVGWGGASSSCTNLVAPTKRCLRFETQSYAGLVRSDRRMNPRATHVKSGPLALLRVRWNERVPLPRFQPPVVEDAF